MQPCNIFDRNPNIVHLPTKHNVHRVISENFIVRHNNDGHYLGQNTNRNICGNCMICNYDQCTNVFRSWHVSLVDHMSPRGHLLQRSISVYLGRYEILRMASVDPHFKSIFKIVSDQFYRNY